MTRGTDVTDMKRTYRTATQGDFPATLELRLEKECDLRYGENPNQAAAMYRLQGTSLAELTNIRLAKSGKGGLSATNFMDVTRALEILKYFEKPAVAVMKHLIPCGFARQYGADTLDEIYIAARDADARSAFGSVVVLNRSVDTATAEALISTYVEGVAAPEYEPGVLDMLSTKQDLRVILYSNLEKLPKFAGDDTEGLYDIRVLPTGRVLVQQPYLSSIKGPDDLITDPLVVKDNRSFIVEREPTERELEDLLTAWYVNLGVRSNGIVVVKNGVTEAIGTGQQERVGAVEQVIMKAYQKEMQREGIHFDLLEHTFIEGLSRNPLYKSVVSSDGFFPFRDSIDLLAPCGVSAVIQPGGSVKDYEVIQAVNEHKMAMAFTLERCFSHF